MSIPKLINFVLIFILNLAKVASPLSTFYIVKQNVYTTYLLFIIYYSNNSLYIYVKVFLHYLY